MVGKEGGRVSIKIHVYCKCFFRRSKVLRLSNLHRGSERTELLPGLSWRVGERGGRGRGIGGTEGRVRGRGRKRKGGGRG